MFSAHRILPKTCDLGSLCHQHLNKKSSKNGIRQTLQKRYPKISKQTHTQRPKRIPKVTQNMCIYIYINTENQPNNEHISTEFWQSMDTRSYSKTQKQKMAGVPPCMLYLLGCPKSGRVQEKQMWLQNKKMRGRSAVYFICF